MATPQPAGAGRAGSNCFSRWTYGWVTPLLSVGRRKALQVEHVWEVDEDQEAGVMFTRLAREEAKLTAGGSRATPASPPPSAALPSAASFSSSAPLSAATPSSASPPSPPARRHGPRTKLLLLLFRLLKRDVLLSAALMFVYAAVQFANPLLLRELVQSVQDESDSGLYLAFALLAAGLLAAVANHAHLHQAFLLGQRARTVLISAIFRRALRLTTVQRKGMEIGEIVNLMSNDTQKLYDLTPVLNVLWAAPLQVAVAAYFIVDFLGPSALVGLGVMVMVAPLTAWFAGINARVRRGHMVVADARVKMVSEVLHNMRTVKLFAWEPSFLRRIMESRDVEMRATLKEARLFARTILSLIIVPSLATAMALVVFSATGNDLTASNAFTVVALFNVLRFPLNHFGQAMSTGAQCWVAVRRLSEFLYPHGDAADADTTPRHYARHPAVDASASGDSDADGDADAAPPLIDVQPCTMAWSEGAVDDLSAAASPDTPAEFRLRCGELGVKAGELVSVVGAVGGGKSTLLQGMLGEVALKPADPSADVCCTVRGSVAFAAQQAWVINASVRDNVLFGQPFDAAWYGRVLDACCLRQDLESFQDGDQTFIGEKGVTLSGGQKQRVALARTVYRKADVVLLDDPLSALDAHTGARVFDRVIGPRGLLKRTARVLVTHASQYLGAADRVVLVHHGEFGFTGTYNELVDLVAAGDLELDPEEMAELSPGAEPAEPPTPPSPLSLSPSSSPPAAAPGDGNGHTEANGGPAAPPAPAGVTANKPPAIRKPKPRPMLANAPAGARGTLRSSMRTLVAAAQEYREGTAGDSPTPASPGVDVTDVSVQPAGEAGAGAGASAGAGTGGSGSAAHDAAGTSDKVAQNIMTKEDRTEGAVSTASILSYIRALGGFGWLVLLFSAFVLERTAFIGIEWWLSVWVSQDDEKTRDFGIGEQSDDFWRMMYLGWVVLSFIFTGCRLYLLVWLFTTAAANLFRQLIVSVFRAPMSFFDTTPIGRIIGRVSYDTETVDTILVIRLNGLIASMFWLGGGISVIISVSPPTVPFLALIVFLFAMLVRFARSSTRELQRLDSLTRSPVHSLFFEALQGGVTVRAFGSEPRFVSMLDSHVDTNDKCLFAFQAANRWLGVRLEFLGACVTLTVALAVWLARNSLSAGLSGLSLNWAFAFTTSLQFISIMVSETEAKFTSAERMLHFATELPAERPWFAPDDPDPVAAIAPKPSRRALPSTSPSTPPPPTSAASPPPPVVAPPDSWPQHGAVEFRDVVLRYRPELEPALRGASFMLRSGEKVGVVGRTGAGKSTLAVALFRLVELDSGSVWIDGIDVATLPLSALRGRGVCIIPQDPVVFSGTVRSALDPFTTYSDADAWQALDTVSMKEAVQGLPGGLSAVVAEGGDNFSVGERALLCLARALLRKPRVLVMDEATASVDPDTDALIQNVIRREFSDTTLLIIAHRLQTVVEADRVLVMGDGVMQEFAPPQELLAYDSAFAGFVDSTGPAASQQLRQMAADAAAARSQHTATQ